MTSERPLALSTECHCEPLTFFTEGAFGGEDVTHVEGEVDPVRDLGIISDELRQKVRVSYNLIVKIISG